MVWFKLRNVVFVIWMKVMVLNVGQWNFIGVFYDYVIGWVYLYYDGIEVKLMNFGKNKNLVIQYEIRIGVVVIFIFSKYKGRFVCLQLYFKVF